MEHATSAEGMVVKFNGKTRKEEVMGRKYCFSCGTKLTELPGFTFNEETGERNFRLVCKKCDPCDHEFKCGGFFKSLFLGKDLVCKKCGYTETTTMIMM